VEFARLEVPEEARVDRVDQRHRLVLKPDVNILVFAV
jgi:hypothetical protein